MTYKEQRKLAQAKDDKTKEKAAEEKVTAAQVVLECRNHLVAPPNRGELSLSTLATLLSKGAWSHIRATQLSLKLFLNKYPHKFSVKQKRLRDTVRYLPAFANGAPSDRYVQDDERP